MIRIRQRSGDAAVAAVLAGLGGFAAYKALEMPLGTVSVPDAGFFPLLCAGGLVLIALWTLARTWRSRPADDVRDLGHTEVVVLVVGLAVLSFTFERYGFAMLFPVLTAVIHRLARQSWMHAALIAGGLSLGAWFFFVVLLGVQLPALMVL
jgi:tripartite tricarboxylate transporter TctB family protein